MTTMYLSRTGVIIGAKGSLAERGVLLVDGNLFYTIERRGGYVTLPKGSFDCTMDFSPKLKRNVFRVKADGEQGHHVATRGGTLAPILIHAGNKPTDIEGCIAPGFLLTQTGVDKSTDAMNLLFQLCGGFVLGNHATLIVDDGAEYFKEINRTATIMA
jgi:Family of unknown function (DUF5675)